MTNPTYLRPQDIKSVAVIGAGSVGASWATLFLAHGIEVIAHDPAPNVVARVRAFIENAWPSLLSLGVASTGSAPLEKLRFASSAAEAAAQADLVQENVPEKPGLKAQVLSEIDAAASPNKVILSSTGGIPPTALQASCRHPERFVVVHPYNPSHLMPLVEVVAGKHTAPEVVQWAMEFSRHVGKQPIRLNTEAPGHMTNRLQAALLREAVYCLVEGIASARDIDAAVRYGLGPRWTLMGSLLTLHLAGGPGGMAGILDHAGRAIEEWWTPLGQPELTPEVKAKLVAAADEVAHGQSIGEWIRWRDENLVSVLKIQQQSEQAVPRGAMD